MTSELLLQTISTRSRIGLDYFKDAFNTLIQQQEISSGEVDLYYLQRKSWLYSHNKRIKCLRR